MYITVITERPLSPKVHAHRFHAEYCGQNQQIPLPDVLRVRRIVDALQNRHSHLASSEETEIERVQVQKYFVAQT